MMTLRRPLSCLLQLGGGTLIAPERMEATMEAMAAASPAEGDRSSYSLQFCPGFLFSVNLLTNVRVFLTLGIFPLWGLPSIFGVWPRTFPAFVRRTVSWRTLLTPLWQGGLSY